MRQFTDWNQQQPRVGRQLKENYAADFDSAYTEAATGVQVTLGYQNCGQPQESRCPTQHAAGAPQQGGDQDMEQQNEAQRPELLGLEVRMEGVGGTEAFEFYEENEAEDYEQQRYETSNNSPMYQMTSRGRRIIPRIRQTMSYQPHPLHAKLIANIGYLFQYT